jgi:transposase
MAAHYGAAVIPGRPYKPRDKAKVEVGVQVVQRWILARLRNRRFFSLAELNQAIRELVGQLNEPTDARMGHYPARAVRSNSIGRRCIRCRRRPTSTPSGSAAG